MVDMPCFCQMGAIALAFIRTKTILIQVTARLTTMYKVKQQTAPIMETKIFLIIFVDTSYWHLNLVNRANQLKQHVLTLNNRYVSLTR